MKRKSNSGKKIEWNQAYDIAERIKILQRKLDIDWIDLKGITCFRSVKAKTRAYARIWGLGRIWQKALQISPAYIIEVISEKFDRLSKLEQDKVLLHEIIHIPKNFSGALVPHIRHGNRKFEDKVERLIGTYKRLKIKY